MILLIPYFPCLDVYLLEPKQYGGQAEAWIFVAEAGTCQTWVCLRDI